jgi:hypothetical protein
MQAMNLAKGYAAIIGMLLVLVGLLGFVNNPLAADPSANPLFVTGTVHNLVHLLTGAIALYIAFGLVGDQQAVGVIGLGVFYIVVLLLTFISPNLFGVLGNSPTYEVNTADNVLNAALGIVSIVVGWLARGSAAAPPAR